MALTPKRALYLALSTLASPAAQIRMAFPFAWKDRVFTMRQPSVFSAFAASSTVALDTGNSRIRCSIPKDAKYCLTFSIDIVSPLFPDFGLTAMDFPDML